ncbi:MAG: TlpA disulfide reductase family protein [bacterium]|nr:TlpA disulfide reductase family protein [bacterium]
MKFILTLFVATFLCSPAIWAAPKSESMVGQVAPQLSGQQAQGNGLLKMRQLMAEFGFKKDAQGKLIEVDGKYVPEVTRNVLVLNFFSTSCVPCIREIPTYNRIAQSFEGKNAKLIYVNVDTEISDADMTRFIAKKKIDLPMLMPNQRDAIRKYKVYSLPRIVVIDKEGKIAMELHGFHDDLEKVLTDQINQLL